MKPRSQSKSTTTLKRNKKISLKLVKIANQDQSRGNACFCLVMIFLKYLAICFFSKMKAIKALLQKGNKVLKDLLNNNNLKINSLKMKAYSMITDMESSPTSI